jgi:hypothetical protein
MDFTAAPRITRPGNAPMPPLIKDLTRNLLFTVYQPDPAARSFLAEAQTQSGPLAEVTVAIPGAGESERLFGVPVVRRGIQPVHLRIVNRSDGPLRLQFVSIDPRYFTPLEAAAVNHFSTVRRLSAFGAAGWFFLPLLGLLPSKLVSAWRANRRMDECFQAQAFHRRAIPAGGVAEGFVFTPFDAGTKVVRVRLLAARPRHDPHRPMESPGAAARGATADKPPPVEPEAAADFTFTLPVNGIAPDHSRRNFSALYSAGEVCDCDVLTLVHRLHGMPRVTTDRGDTGTGDPVNLVIIGEFETLLSAFAGRWDETETITLATCWKTARAFLLGSEYRYSPVSPLYLFGRSQDVALQRIRSSINERLHLRLWLTPLTHRGQPVWIGQVSRDIGVRFTTKVWNLTTHRIDPDVDESRDYVFEDLLDARHVDVAGYVDASPPCDRTAPRRNLTGDPYFTDGKRAVIQLSAARTTPRFVAWG